MRALATVIALPILVATSAIASAEPPGMTPSLAFSPAPEAEQEIPSYRLQTVLVDASAIAVGVVGSKISHSDNAAFDAGVAVYALGAPILHLVHNHPARAVTSLGLRLGLPVLGAFVGGGLGKRNCSEDCDNDADIAGTAMGILVGAITASAIDIGYLSRGETVTRSAPGLSPTFSTGPNGAVRLGIGGSF